MMILHDCADGREIIVNPNNVTDCYETTNWENKKCTEVDFINDDYVKVRESMEEIKEMLGLAEEEAEILAARKGEE